MRRKKQSSLLLLSVLTLVSCTTMPKRRLPPVVDNPSPGLYESIDAVAAMCKPGTCPELTFERCVEKLRHVAAKLRADALEVFTPFAEHTSGHGGGNTDAVSCWGAALRRKSSR